MEQEKKSVKKVIAIVAFGVILFWILQNLSLLGGVIGTIFALVTPFIIGICIAFILNIPMSRMEKSIFAPKKTKKNQKPQPVKKGTRVLTIIISLAIFIFVIWFVLFLVLPELFTAFHVMKENVPSIMVNFQNWLGQITANAPDLSNQIRNIQIDWENAGQQIWKFAQSGVTSVVQTSINFVMATVNTIINFVIGLIFAVYLLLQKEKLINQAKKIIYAYCEKEKADKIMRIATLSNKTFNDFIGGQFLEACILGTLCFIGMLILGLPYAAAISVLVGVMALIPLLGAFIGAGVGVILIGVTSPIEAVIFVIFIIVLQQIEGNLIYPKVVGKSVGLPSIWVLVAITIGGGLAGLAGIILSVPICSIIYVLLRENVNERLEEKQISIK